MEGIPGKGRDNNTHKFNRHIQEWHREPSETSLRFGEWAHWIPEAKLMTAQVPRERNSTQRTATRKPFTDKEQRCDETDNYQTGIANISQTAG